MPTVTVIDPVTRLEGHLKIEVTVDQVNGVQQVVAARATGTLFRGLEKILVSRTPADAQHITQRICGVCPVSHGLASVLAQEGASGALPPMNAVIMRNLVLGANYIQSHILHFYHLALQDFVNGPDMPPWQPSWQVDKRIDDPATNDRYVSNYVTALDMRRMAHEMGAVFGGKLPHTPAFVAGGVTAMPIGKSINTFANYLNQLLPFIADVYIPDVELLAEEFYPDYFSIGSGPGNLLAFGVFDLDREGHHKLFKPGEVTNGHGVRPVDVSKITEYVKHSWYDNATDDLNPIIGATQPQHPKADAYSWLKSPRYRDLAYEVGPLARMWVNGDYRRGMSVMDRHLARAYETLKIAEALRSMLGQLHAAQPSALPTPMPDHAWGIGLTEAPRGALGHWLNVADGAIANYQVITPTCWNASPRDTNGQPGPIEQALLGTPVENVAEPIEVTRVIHSYDPCLACAVHVMRPAEDARIFALDHFHGGEEIHGHGHGEGHGDGSHDE